MNEYGKLEFTRSDPLRAMALLTMQFLNKGYEFKQPYTKDTTEQAGFILVKDEGIYLIPAFKHEGTPTELGYVVYAKDYNPKLVDSEELWHRTHDFSGDDFAEFIPLDRKMLRHLSIGADLQLDVTEEHIKVTVSSIRHRSKYNKGGRNATS